MLYVCGDDGLWIRFCVYCNPDADSDEYRRYDIGGPRDMGNNNNKKSNMSDANLPNTMSSHSSNQTRSVIFVPHIYVNGAFLDHSVVPRLEIRI